MSPCHFFCNYFVFLTTLNSPATATWQIAGRACICPTLSRNCHSNPYFTTETQSAESAE
ncbi:hypothetical protein GLYMA_20G153650v4 [Glycine max]|nr:hypothetical protein GLYMA_20G153650v4 [Glycine max]KAH1036246.1 hypothetical protein GYH30_055961 [Glycine max]